MLLWTEENWLEFDMIAQRNGFYWLFIKKKIRLKSHSWQKYPTSWPAILLDHIHHLRSAVCCSPWGRKGRPGAVVCPLRALLCLCCSWQQQLAETSYMGSSFWRLMQFCNSWESSVGSNAVEGICILNIHIFQRCLWLSEIRKGCSFFFSLDSFVCTFGQWKENTFLAVPCLDIEWNNTEFSYTCCCYVLGMTTYRDM